MDYETNILVVTGASGAGKTTAVKGLEARNLPGVRCFYFDQIGVPTPEEMQRDFGGGEQWQAAATKRWMMRFAQEENSGYLCVLDGQTRPSFVQAALSELAPLTARIILFDCRPDVRKDRLTKRGQPELADQRMDYWAVYLRGQWAFR
jgi:dephospho-CoA kinase